MNYIKNRRIFMFCPNCGNQLTDGVAFCSNCGTKIAPVSPDTPAAVPIPQTDPVAPELVKYINMKWHNFLINFGLWAGAVINLSMAIELLFGLNYTTETYGGKTENISDMIYAMFDGLQMIDIVFGVLIAGIAVLGIYTRFQLSAFRESGPKLLLAIYCSSTLWNIAYTVCVVAIVGFEILDGTKIISNAVTDVILSVAAVIINYIYYSKRSNLFTN